MNRIENLKKWASEELAAAKAITDTAVKAGRELTAAELSAHDTHLEKAADHTNALRAAKADQEILQQAKAIAREIGEPLKEGQTAPSSPATRRKVGRTSPWAKAAADRVTRAMITTIEGQKGLISGSVGVPVPIETDIVALSDAPRSLLELIPVKPLTSDGFSTGNSFQFLRQTVRNHAADVVADGEVKPTSIYELAEVEDRVRVIASLSEPVAERWLADYGNLESFLASELEAGIHVTLENQILSGDGTGENLTGILETSGIQTQAFATDMLTSIRKGLTKLQLFGITPTALVLNPTDLEALDLLREDGATGGFLLGSPDGAEAANIWRVPRVPSVAVTAGTALLADWNQAEIIIREDAILAVDRSGTLFTKNQAVLRVEGRFGFAVKRPLSFVEIDLAA